LAVLPVSLGYVTRARAPKQALQYGAMFVLGMILAHGLLGAAAGLGGASAMGWAERFPALARSQRGFDIGGGILLALAGLYPLNAYFFWIPSLAI